MTTACDSDEVRDLPELAGGGDVITPNIDDAILVTSPTEKHERTARSELDVHTAITGGLAAYLMQLVGAIDGRSTQFASVISDWADYDDGARGYPAAAVHSEEIGQYDTTSGMGKTEPVKIAGSQVTDATAVPALASTGIYALNDLTVGVMCTDKVMRVGVRRMLERGFSPVPWMVGFRLILPRYHNAIATFLAVTAQTPDTEELAKANLRPLVFKLQARCPVYHLHTLPMARPLAVRTSDGTAAAR